jgi:protein-tyrosine-phosphatase
MYKALVLDATSPAGIESTQALGRARVRVTAAYGHLDALGLTSRYVADRQRQPDDAPEFEHWITALDAAREFDLIVPSTELALVALRFATEDGSLWRKAVLPSRTSLDIALQKARTGELAMRLGIPVPRSRVITSEGEPATLGFPVVLKPATSQVQVEARTERWEAAIARDARQRATNLRHLLRGTHVVEQEFVSGRGIGVELLYERGHCRWSFSHERLHELPLTGGASTYRRAIAAPPAMLDAAVSLLDALEWHGVAMVEFRAMDERNFHLMEINPRLWGSLALSIDAGVNFPLGMLALATGTPLPPQPSYRRGYRTRKIRGDLTWMKDNLVTSRSDPLLLTRPRALSALEWLLPLVGRESWDHFDWWDLGVTWRITRTAVAEQLGNIGRKVQGVSRRRRLRRRHRRTLARGGSTPPASVLFLCYGNICRSALAEAVMRRIAPNVRVASAGFHEVENRRSPAQFVDAAEAAGINLASHRSRLVTDRLLSEHDLVVVMDAGNLRLLREDFGRWEEKVVALGPFEGDGRLEIADPYPMRFDDALAVALQIDAAVRGLARWLEDGVTPPEP